MARGNSIVTSVRAVLRGAHNLPAITIEDVASDLGLSVRVLQKRLSREGTRFREQLDHERLERASAMLRATKLTLREVAQRLGYADASTLLRAFKRWTGMASRRWRIGARRRH